MSGESRMTGAVDDEEPEGSDAVRREGPPTSMRDALRRFVARDLCTRGFTGKLPHLRRVTPQGTHTFTVQTSKWGGEFIIELGRAPAGPYRTATGEAVPAERLTSYHLRGSHRARLRRRTGAREVWFRYTPTAWDRLWSMARRWFGDSQAPKNPFARAAIEVFIKLDECERWWAGEDGLPFIRSEAESLIDQGGVATLASPGGTERAGDEAAV
jgi:hypothetical protein